MTRDEALEIYNAGQEAVIEVLLKLNKIIEFQEERIRVLEIKVAQLLKNSSNSSKRPSSDDITKPKLETRVEGKGRKIGAQDGHPKNERIPFSQDEIDKSHKYILDSCPICKGEVKVIIDGKPRVIQQVEIIEVPIIKEEHISYPVWCEKCGKIHYMSFPPEIIKQGLFKERITALVAYMKNVCHASFSTLRKFIRDILKLKVSRGYLRKLIEKVSLSLEDPYNELLKRLPLETRLNVDETGHKENGEKYWTWVFKAELYVLFKIDSSRGSQVLIDVLGAEFNGILGCDYFSAYRKYMKDFNISIQFCIAHLIRDVRFLINMPDVETKDYGQRLLDAIKNMFKVIHDHEMMTSEIFQIALERARSEIIRVAIQEAPSKLDKNGKEEKKEAQNMAKRFILHGEAYFEFITNPQIDPTNNVAEQAVRFIVIDRHITQGTRSIKGRESSERIWSVIATCGIQSRSSYNFILESIKAYFHNQPAPSLLADTS